MSAARIIRRKAWAVECPPVFEQGTKYHHTYREIEVPVGDPKKGKRKKSFVKVGGAVPKRRDGRKADFHTWSVARGHRHKTFQLILRARREALGLSPTTTNMHKAPCGGSATGLGY